MGTITKRIIAAFALGIALLLGLTPTSHATATAAVAPIAVAADVQATSDGHSDKDYTRAFQSLSAKIASGLGRHLGLREVITKNSSELEAPALMYTDVFDAQGGHAGTPASCNIWVNPSGDRLQGPDWSVTLAHEIFHCFQGVILGLPRFSRLATGAQTKWIIEGQADWVGEMVAAPDPSEDAGWWDTYLSQPQTPLFTRTYDAIGFYAHVAERCGGPSHVWRKLQGMLDKVPDNRAAYGVVTAGCGASFLDSWASGYFREPDRGSAWDTTGPAIPAGGTGAAAPQVKVIALANGQEIPVSADLYTNGIYEFTSHADVVTMGLRGNARLSDAGNFDHVLAGETTFCTRVGGCTCPPGSAYQGPTLTPLTTPADLAVTGGSDGSGTRLHLVGISLADFCTRMPTRIVYRPGGPLPNPCHLVTMSDVQQILGRNPQYVYQTMGPHGNRSALVCEHIVVAMGLKAPGSDSGAVAIGVQQRSGTKYLGPGKAIGGLGDQAHLFLPDASGDAILVVAKGRLTITIEVTFGTRSTRIARAIARKALSRL